MDKKERKEIEKEITRLENLCKNLGEQSVDLMEKAIYHAEKNKEARDKSVVLEQAEQSLWRKIVELKKSLTKS